MEGTIFASPVVTPALAEHAHGGDTLARTYLANAEFNERGEAVVISGGY